MNTRMPIIYCSIFMLLIAGCAYVPSGDEVNVGFTGSLNASSSSFSMEGNITVGGGIPDRQTYRDMTVNLFSEDGDLLLTKKLGNLRTDAGRLDVSIAIQSVPHYVIIESPDFWQEPMQVEYYVRMDSNYSVEYATARDELPAEITP